MVHSGYEASAVDDTFGSVKGFLATARATLFGPRSAPQSTYEISQPMVELKVHGKSVGERESAHV
jgi:hypothetical protein